MAKFFAESLPHDFEWGIAAVSGSSFGDYGQVDVTLHRDDNLRLRLELSGPPSAYPHVKEVPAGTIHQPSDTINFNDAAGGQGVARGVFLRSTNESWRAGSDTRQTNTYGLNSLEWTFPTTKPTAQIIDWVTNVPDNMIWYENDRVDHRETYLASIGAAPPKLLLRAQAHTMLGSKSLRVVTCGYDVVVRRAHKHADQMIIYNPAAPADFRTKFRECLSFVLGAPILYLGSTEYTEAWSVNSTTSYSSPAFSPYVKTRETSPPYPLADGSYRNMISRSVLERALNGLLHAYDTLSFNELSWAYWFAVYAPIHMAPVHFGALIERVMTSNAGALDGQARSLLDAGQRTRLRKKLTEWLDAEQLDTSVRGMLEGKIGGLSQPPAAERLKRLAKAIGLQTTELEIESWKQRNLSAHGGPVRNPLSAILNAKVQAILFARMVAALTDCANSYVDHYSLHHPVRPLAQGVPARV